MELRSTLKDAAAVASSKEGNTLAERMRTKRSARDLEMTKTSLRSAREEMVRLHDELACAKREISRLHALSIHSGHHAVRNPEGEERVQYYLNLNNTCRNGPVSSATSHPPPGTSSGLNANHSHLSRPISHANSQANSASPCTSKARHRLGSHGASPVTPVTGNRGGGGDGGSRTQGGVTYSELVTVCPSPAVSPAASPSGPGPAASPGLGSIPVLSTGLGAACLGPPHSNGSGGAVTARCSSVNAADVENASEELRLLRDDLREAAQSSARSAQSRFAIEMNLQRHSREMNAPQDASAQDSDELPSMKRQTMPEGDDPTAWQYGVQDETLPSPAGGRPLQQASHPPTAPVPLSRSHLPPSLPQQLRDLQLPPQLLGPLLPLRPKPAQRAYGLRPLLPCRHADWAG